MRSTTCSPRWSAARSTAASSSTTERADVRRGRWSSERWFDAVDPSHERVRIGQATREPAGAQSCSARQPSRLEETVAKNRREQKEEHDGIPNRQPVRQPNSRHLRRPHRRAADDAYYAGAENL